MAQRILTLILLLCSTSTFAGLFDAPGRSQFVPADRAFVFDFQQNQHYLYRKQISITPSQADIAEVKLPPGVWHEDEFYGKSEIYRKQLTVPITVNQAKSGATLTITYQGCADAGFCYPPETKTVPLSEVSSGSAAPPAPAPATADPQEKPQPTAQLPFSALWALLIGIGIAFTPCVLPMYPLISGIVLGSLYGLMPLYLNHRGVSDSGIGFWMAVMVSAGILGQWPIGRLADRYGRLLVLRVQVFVVILGCIAMLNQAMMAPALFILGAAGFTLYPVAMAWACEKVEHHQLVAMNQELLLSYTIGSLLGPTFTAMLMQNYSDNLLFIMIAGVSFVYLMMLLRKAGHHPTPVAHA